MFTSRNLKVLYSVGSTFILQNERKLSKHLTTYMSSFHVYCRYCFLYLLKHMNKLSDSMHHKIPLMTANVNLVLCHGNKFQIVFFNNSLNKLHTVFLNIFKQAPDSLQHQQSLNMNNLNDTKMKLRRNRDCSASNSR